jgi:hypothetical protein
VKRLKYKYMVEQLCKDESQKEILSFKNYKVIKMPRIFQSVFYFLGYNREDLCEVNTNKIFWKTAKNHWNDSLFKKITEYAPNGSKDSEYKRYWVINFIEKNLAGLEFEAVEEYNSSLARLFKWLQTTIEMRKEDIVKRKQHKDKLREEREERIANEAERCEKRDAQLEEAKQVNTFF